MFGSMMPLKPPKLGAIAVVASILVVVAAGAVIFDALVAAERGRLPSNSRPLIMVPMPPG